MDITVTQIIALCICAIGLMITLAASVLIWTFKREIKRIDEVERENGEIKDNYLSRFEEIKVRQDAHHSETLKELSNIKVDIAGLKAKYN